MKKFCAFYLTVLAVFAVFSVNIFASDTGIQYLINENFSSYTGGSSVPGFTFATQTSGNLSGSIGVDTYQGDNCVKYQKSVNRTDIAHYSDVSYPIPKNSDFVFQVTFWFTGSLADVNSSFEFFSGRKMYENNTGPEFVLFLRFQNGAIVDGSENVIIPSLTENTKYTIAVSVHDEAKKFDVYLNGEKKSTCDFNNTKGDNYTSIRAINLTGMKSNIQDPEFPVFYADDFKLYYSSAPDQATPENPAPENPVPENPSTDTPAQNGESSKPSTLPTYEKEDFVFTATVPETTTQQTSTTINESTRDVVTVLAVSAASVIIIGSCALIKSILSKNSDG